MLIFSSKLRVLWHCIVCKDRMDPFCSPKSKVGPFDFFVAMAEDMFLPGSLAR